MAALVLIAAFPAAGLKSLVLHGAPRILFQLYLAGVVAAYFVWFWTHGGQTLAMKTWRFRLVDTNGRGLTVARALVRFAAAAVFFGPACVGIVLIFFPNRISAAISMWTFVPLLATLLWARFDDNRQFLHDRLAGTRLVIVD